MLRYILRRILLFIPTLIAISLLTFFISINAPGDPVEIMLNRIEGNESEHGQKLAEEKDYSELRHKLGFDLPIFYFSLTDATVSDTLYKIPKSERRETLKRLSNEYGSWGNVSAYYLSIKELERKIYLIPKYEYNSEGTADIKNAGTKNMLSDFIKSTKADNATESANAKKLIAELYNNYEEEKNKKTLSKLSKRVFESLKYKDDSLTGEIIFLTNYDTLVCDDIYSAFQKMVSEKNSCKKYIPVIHWYGFRNQYHHWIINFLRGDFGVSYQDKRPVSSVVYGAMEKTLGLSLMSILLAYLIAIPLGVHSAIKKGTQGEKTITTTLFVLYSLPNFWIATMLVIFLCGGDYLSWFPAPGGSPIPDDAPLWYKFSEGCYRLLLPLFCWTYGSLAFISRQMRGGILASITQDYIQTARAKGLDEKKIIWKHAMKNSLLPVITLFASIFPLAISGSFVIETIFNIPGIGKLSLDALYARDYPIIFTVMMFTAILTMLGYLVADILYALVDPRISYTKKS